MPWVILKIEWSRRLSVGEQQVTSNLVNEVHIPRVAVSDISAAVTEGSGGYPAENSEVDMGRRCRGARQGGTVHRDDEVIC